MTMCLYSSVFYCSKLKKLLNIHCIFQSYLYASPISLKVLESLRESTKDFGTILLLKGPVKSKQRKQLNVKPHMAEANPH